MRVLSPRIEPPLRVLDGSTASTATRWPALDEVQPERLDERRLPRAGRAGDADADRAAGVREHLGEQRLGVVAVVGPGRLDERDRARQRRAGHRRRRRCASSLTRQSAPDVDPASACVRRAGGGRAISAAALRDVGAGAEDRGDAGLAQLVVVLRGDHAADDHEDVVAALLAQLRDELGHERLVPGGLARHADDVHVVLDRVARRFLGRLEQRADVDVEAEVGERGGDHLGAAVVAVLAELRDEDARPAAFALRRTRRPRARMRVVAPRRPRRRAVHARDAYGSSARWRANTSSSASEISPTVARARVASIDELEQVAVARARPRAARRARPGTRASSRFAVTLREPRELLLADRRRCRRRGRRRRAPRSRRYLLTPTMTSSPRSTAAWRRAAASSMRSFGMPDSTALVMPPSASTSSISFHASLARLRGERLDVVAAAERVDDVGDAGLLGEDQLRVARDAGRELGRAARSPRRTSSCAGSACRRAPRRAPRSWCARCCCTGPAR